jgi:HPr kinase/phosphorylase
VVVLGTAGVLFRGPPGAGKSSLALALMARSRLAGRLGVLVADDRVALSAEGGRLVARAPATIAGLAELSGRGILQIDHEPAAVVSLVVDLAPFDAVERMPEPSSACARINGVDIRRQVAPARSMETACLLVETALSGAQMVADRAVLP